VEQTLLRGCMGSRGGLMEKYYKVKVREGLDQNGGDMWGLSDILVKTSSFSQRPNPRRLVPTSLPRADGEC